MFGLPLTIFDYSSQVFPPLLMAAVLGLVYKGLKKVIPENIQLIFVPFISMLVMIPLTAFLIGPIGVYAGAALANLLSSINSFSPFIFAIVIPLAYPFMVPLGLHWPINAIMLLNIQTLGYDFIQGPMGAWNFACFGATAGVLVLAWREKDKQMRQTATGALAAGLLGGISEPSLYGIHLRFKRIYPRMLVGCPHGRSHHRHRFAGAGSSARHHDAGVRLHLVADDPRLQPDRALPGRRCRRVRGRDGARHHLRLQEPEPAGAAVAAATAGAASVAPVWRATASWLSPAAASSPVSPVKERRPRPRSPSVPPPWGADPARGTVGRNRRRPRPGARPRLRGRRHGPRRRDRAHRNTVYAPGAGTVVAAQPTGHAFGLQLDNGARC
jgi:PTS system beta-glucosides-specific IIC component